MTPGRHAANEDPLIRGVRVHPEAIPQNGSAGPAVLSLDGAGRVTAANASARTLWQAGDTELIGEPFAALFVFEVTAQDPETIRDSFARLKPNRALLPLYQAAVARQQADHLADARETPVPLPIVNQLATCLFAAGYTTDMNLAKAIVAVETGSLAAA